MKLRTHTQAQQLESLAYNLHAVAFDFAEAARSHHFAERRAAEHQRIAAAVRAVVRGGTRRTEWETLLCSTS